VAQEDARQPGWKQVGVPVPGICRVCVVHAREDVVIQAEEAMQGTAPLPCNVEPTLILLKRKVQHQLARGEK
jgi:hypothetical protein